MFQISIKNFSITDGIRKVTWKTPVNLSEVNDISDLIIFEDNAVEVNYEEYPGIKGDFTITIKKTIKNFEKLKTKILESNPMINSVDYLNEKLEINIKTEYLKSTTNDVKLSV